MAEKVPWNYRNRVKRPFINPRKKKGIHSAVYIRSPEKVIFNLPK